MSISDFIKKNSALIILILIISLGAFLRFYQLGASSFARDEFFDLSVPYGYHKTGQWLSWDYNFERPFQGEMQKEDSNERAEIYRWQLAQIYRFFEPSESVSRSISALWGVLGVILVFFVARYFTKSAAIALIAAFLAAAGESEIIFSRRLRMYSMFYPVYLAFAYLFYRFLESEYRGKVEIFKKIREKFGINLFYFLPALLLGLVSYNTHVLTGSFILALGAYCAILFLWKFRRLPLINKYSALLGSLAGGGLFINIFLPKFSNLIEKKINFFEDNYSYFERAFTDFRHPLVLGTVLAAIGVFYLFKRAKLSKEALWLSASLAAPLFAAVFIWQRTPANRFIYFLLSFVSILSACGIYYLALLIKEKAFKFKGALVLLIILALVFLPDYSHLYGKKSVYKSAETYSDPDFRKVFRYVLENKKPDDVFITRAYQSFYFRDFQIKVYDVKSEPFEKKNCGQRFQEIINDNSSGWVILAGTDKLSVCSNGYKYLDDNLEKISADKIGRGVKLYRWDR